MIRSISELFPVYNLLSLTPIEILGVPEGPEGKLGWCTHEILIVVSGLGSARCVQSVQHLGGVRKGKARHLRHLPSENG